MTKTVDLHDNFELISSIFYLFCYFQKKEQIKNKRMPDLGIENEM